MGMHACILKWLMIMQLMAMFCIYSPIMSIDYSNVFYQAPAWERKESVKIHQIQSRKSRDKVGRIVRGKVGSSKDNGRDQALNSGQTKKLFLFFLNKIVFIYFQSRDAFIKVILAIACFIWDKTSLSSFSCSIDAQLRTLYRLHI